jgi:hypothetical protein
MPFGRGDHTGPKRRNQTRRAVYLVPAGLAFAQMLLLVER